MSQSTVEFFGPHNAHDVIRKVTQNGTAVTLFDPDHVQWNKRCGEAESTAALTFSQGGDWVNIRMEEVTRHAEGRISSRTISMTIPREMMGMVAMHLSSGNRDIAKEQHGPAR